MAEQVANESCLILSKVSRIQIDVMHMFSINSTQMIGAGLSVQKVFFFVQQFINIFPTFSTNKFSFRYL